MKYSINLWVHVSVPVCARLSAWQSRAQRLMDFLYSKKHTTTDAELKPDIPLTSALSSGVSFPYHFISIICSTALIRAGLKEGHVFSAYKYLLVLEGSGVSYILLPINAQSSTWNHKSISSAILSCPGFPSWNRSDSVVFWCSRNRLPSVMSSRALSSFHWFSYFQWQMREKLNDANARSWVK